MTTLKSPMLHLSRPCYSATFVAVLLLTCLDVSPRETLAQGATVVWPAEWQANSAFFNLWSRADAPVETGAAARSWLWGPLPFAVANEPYKESPTGQRLVQYFDKGRMEINDPAADRASAWFVTSGLLVNEMVTGQVQIGQAEFQTLAPSQEPVAGDAGSPEAPSYADLARYTAPDADATGSQVTRMVAKGGAMSPYSGTLSGPVNITTFDATTRHNVPAVFADWVGQKSTVLEGGRLVQDQVVDPLFVLGHPITDPYWANVLVGGAPRTVLVQLFERRALTYDPSNPPEWRVEMANVGQAYYDWRYSSSGPGPSIAASLGSDGIVVRGWNWPAAATVSLQIVPQQGGGDLSGQADVAADGSGRFVFTVPYSQPLKDALQTSTPLQIRAASGQASAALPLAGTPPSAIMRVEGAITLVERGDTGMRLTMEQPDGSQYSMTVPSGAAIATSEGSPASAAVIDAGMAAVADGELSNGVISVGTLRLLSLSRTGARVNYQWSADGANLFVGGSGWPGGRDVGFAVGTADGPQTSFAHVTADSGGDFSTSINPPAGMEAHPEQWLFATSMNGTDVVAQFGVQAASLGTAAAPPTYQLYITGPMGGQRAGAGASCVSGKCRGSGSVLLPLDAMAVTPGSVLGLRTQSGTDPNLGPSATSMSAQLFTYPAGVQGQGGGSVVPFTPGGTPLYSTGNLPGHPFSISLPKSLPAGRYVIVVSVSWPDTKGGKNSGTYAFTVQVP